MNTFHYYGSNWLASRLLGKLCNFKPSACSNHVNQKSSFQFRYFRL